MVKQNIFETEVKNKYGYKLAKGYTRVVSSERGPYIEIPSELIVKENIYIPNDKKWKLFDPKCYYIEYRSKDVLNTKVYFQKRRVNYANYLIGYFYINILETNIIIKSNLENWIQIKNKKTIVIDLHKINSERPEYDIYMGRATPGTEFTEHSKWANIFRINEDRSNIEEALDMFNRYLDESQELLDDLPTLIGQKLGCWCNRQPWYKPGLCHVDIIIKKMKQRNLI